MRHSIQNRLLVTSTCVLGIFLAITGWVLDRSFQTSVITGAEEQLRLVIYSLMGSVEEQGGQLLVNNSLSEPRLTQPDSGLYAKVADDLSQDIWRSPSAVTTNVMFPQVDAEPGVFVFSELREPHPRFFLSYTVIWEGADTEQVIFSAATDQQPFRVSIAQFRRSLGLGLGAGTLVFILAQLFALRWGLSPLRSMAQEVQALESGEREALSGGYPRELQGLAENLEKFVEHEKRSRSRYRNALEDLAHSLKTPLAVVRNSLLEVTPDKVLLGEQLHRMETTVTHQLSKASASGPATVGKSVVLADVAERLLRALNRAYVDRGIQVDCELDKQVVARGDERDMLEILGNLLENAFKYTHKKVRVEICWAQNEQYSKVPCVMIEDDGRGIPKELREDVLDRGHRLDELESGQGIGLAVVNELVQLYDGRLEISDSELGGAKVSVYLV